MSCANLHECDCEDESLVEKAQEYLKGILDQLYGYEEINVELLENNLDELSHLLGVELPGGILSVQRRWND